VSFLILLPCCTCLLINHKYKKIVLAVFQIKRKMQHTWFSACVRFFCVILLSMPANVQFLWQQYDFFTFIWKTTKLSCYRSSKENPTEGSVQGLGECRLVAFLENFELWFSVRIYVVCCSYGSCSLNLKMLFLWQLFSKSEDGCTFKYISFF
jgi:hypothetical protein